MLNIKRILVATDFEWGGEQALRHAVVLAAEFKAELHVLHIVVGPLHEDRGVLSFVAMEELCSRMKQAVRQYQHLVASSGHVHGILDRYAVRRHVEAAQGILDYAADYKIDLIVMGTRGRREARRSVAGSTATRVVRRALCSVLTVGVDNLFLPGLMKRILVPVDFSERNAHALTLAKLIARKTRAQLTLLHVIEPSLYLGPRPGSFIFSARRSVRNAYTDLEQFYRYARGPDVSHRYHVVQGRPAQQIISTAKQQDAHLIVQGCRENTDTEAFRHGSVAEDIMRQAPCPVLTVRGASPIPVRGEQQGSQKDQYTPMLRRGIPA